MLGTNQTKLGHQNKQRGQKVELKTYTDSRNIHIQTRLLGDLSSYNIFFLIAEYLFLSKRQRPMPIMIYYSGYQLFMSA